MFFEKLNFGEQSVLMRLFKKV